MDRRTDNPGTILIVDDWPQNTRLLSKFLTVSGHTIHTAQSGQEALDLVPPLQPDLILLDIQMPEMDGFEVCRRLKAAEDTRQIPIIFISALSEVADVVQGLHLGAADYVTKPFQIEEVTARVETQIAMVRQYQEIQRLRERDRQQFEMLDKMKNEFIQMATHDLKNPLGVIIGYAQLLNDVVEVPSQYASLYTEALAGIESSVEKMKTLVTDILDLAQVQAVTDLELEPTPVAPFLVQALDGFALLAQQKDITLNVTLPPDDVYWAIDASRMARVVDNLVSNAIKYTDAEGRVEVTVDVTAQQVILRVADNGFGIPADNIPRLFDAFFRVRSPKHREVEGTGLGLSVVKAIVEQHQGEITVESDLGAGSVFSVALPRQFAGLAPDDTTQAAEQTEVPLTM